MFGDRDEGVDHLITVLADHIERIDAHRIGGVGQIDQHHVVLLARGNQPAERVNHIAVWLDEGKTGSACTLSTRSQSTHCLRQVLEERTFALAGAGDGEQVVT